jgi:hypothetical protein
VLLPNVMERINGAFPIFSSGLGHVYEVVDRQLDPVKWDPEGIREAYIEFLYGEHGLRANIAAYLAKEIPSINPELCESVCDLVTYEIEERFRSEYQKAECAQQIVERTARQYAPLLAD